MNRMKLRGFGFDLKELNEFPFQSLPKISLYLDLHGSRYERRESVDRLLRQALTLLLKTMPLEKAKEHMRSIFRAPFPSDSEYRRETLAVLCCGPFLRFGYLPIRVASYVVVAKSFHIKPILQAFNNREEFLLCMLDNTSKGLKGQIYEGSSSKLWTRGEIVLEPKQTLRERLPSDALRGGRPIFLAPGNFTQDQADAISSEHGVYLLESSYEGGVSKRNAEALLPEVLRTLHSLKRMEDQRALDEYWSASHEGRALFDVPSIVEKVKSNEVSKLFIASDLFLWANWQNTDETLSISSFQANGKDDDLLDDLAEIALKNARNVVVLPSYRMPQPTPIAAILNPPPLRRSV